ncbi:hypothetical protein Poli38472_002720 [Pythium oligandrum]|uniref:Endonuclease/exonuclease/phosphatase domain-containing protein n=1 Tax=Pythium oligandrum TaxID=41045 RepID=A0A8K1FK34_PYTOL|nr:hypothetical protein Poli38472_002720 [Pythium oligandrum]|eukprot:TMW63779.1 hypothetical protein Poli38472_002720 [Pythium oligandrum]
MMKKPASERALNPFAASDGRRRVSFDDADLEEETLLHAPKALSPSTSLYKPSNPTSRRQLPFIALGLVIGAVLGLAVGYVQFTRMDPGLSFAMKDGVQLTRQNPGDKLARVSTDPFVLRVMTFNLRYGTAMDGLNSWPHRRAHVAELINRYHPVLLGTQEGMDEQLRQLHEMLVPQYERFGDPREDGGEHTQIFYDAHVVERVQGGTFWLSETPQVPKSRGWDASHVRVATWGRFRLRTTQQEFFYVNTHLDNTGKLAQLNGAKVIWTEMKKLVGNTLTPLFLTGDFNTLRPSDVYEYLTTNPEGPFFHDAWRVAEHPIGSISNSYHEWIGPAYDKTKHGDWLDAAMDQPDIPGANHIDFILSRPQLPVTTTEVITESRNGRYPSDHYPIVAEFLFPSATELPPPST